MCGSQRGTVHWGRPGNGGGTLRAVGGRMVLGLDRLGLTGQILDFRGMAGGGGQYSGGGGP